MRKQFSIEAIILLFFVIVLGFIIGGGAYEARVLVPLWSTAPPDSVIAFYQHNATHPDFVTNQGGRFWVFVTPLGTLLTLAMLISAFWTRSEHRKWRLSSAVLALIAYGFTISWFVPTIVLLMSSEVLTMGRDEVATLT